MRSSPPKDSFSGESTICPMAVRFGGLGFLGNVVVGGVTAIVLTALYSPLGSLKLGSAGSAGTTYDLTLTELAGALLSGLGGARLLTQEVSRHYDQLAQEKTRAAVDSLTTSARRGESTTADRK
jgi:hypothetical protein